MNPLEIPPFRRVGRLSRKRGGTINTSKRCWSIWALKRIPLARKLIGEADAKKSETNPAIKKTVFPESFHPHD
jgi:hypothetical protein